MCKKILTLITSMAVILLLAACGSSSETTVPSGSTTPSVATKPVQTTVSTTPETTAPAVTESLLVDSEDCIVKVTGFDQNDLLGFSMKLFIENKEDENLMFSIRDASVNGFMIDPFWANEVAAGKKANETVTFLKSDLEKNGIETVEEITFTLVVYESDEITTEHLVEKTFTVKP
jgi:outer membrane lipopolysaccharide assembly protein LptE/RlpB